MTRSILLLSVACLLSAACSSSNDGTTTKTVDSADGGDGGGSDGSTSTTSEDTRPCGANTIENGTFDLEFGGTAYQYIVHVPPGYDGTKRTPLVVNWHGLTSDGAQQELFSGMDAVADENEFIVVYPVSPDKSWNAGICCAFSATDRDDVGFARALVEKVSNEACINSKRVYSTGMSNGGFMSHRLGCEAADLFAAVAPVAGYVGIPDCNPSRPIAVMDFHGTADTLVDYDTGGLLNNAVPGLGGIPDMLQAWADRDGCNPEPEQTYQQGTVTCKTWSGCKASVSVTLCTAEGEGHCWPGTNFCPFGAFTLDIDASREIAKFFAKYTLP